MAGDKGGWLQALWVPIVGVMMILTIWMCDRLLLSGFLHRSWPPSVSYLFSSCSQLCPTTNLHPEPVHSLELVHSSLHQLPPHSPPPPADDAAEDIF
jgi:hypothetical protein